MRAILKVTAILVLIAVLALSEISLMYWLGGNDVRKFCHEIKPGVPLAQLEALAKKYDVRYLLPGLRQASGEYLVLVNTPRSFGRHTCTVLHDKMVISGSEYGYAD